MGILSIKKRESKSRVVEIPFEIIELECNSYHIITHMSLPNGESGDMVIDTGASRTVLDKYIVENIAKKESITSEICSGGIGGEIEDIDICSIEYMNIGCYKIEYPQIAIIDLESINVMYSQHCNRHIVGLLGSDILVKYRATIDYAKSKLYFFT